jgi:hypothetical protein
MTHSEFTLAAAAAAVSPVTARHSASDRVIATPVTFAEFATLCARTKELPSTYISKASGRTDMLYIKRDPKGTREDSNYDRVPLASVTQWLASCERRNKSELQWRIADNAPVSSEDSSSATSE